MVSNRVKRVPKRAKQGQTTENGARWDPTGKNKIKHGQMGSNGVKQAIGAERGQTSLAKKNQMGPNIGIIDQMVSNRANHGNHPWVGG